VAAHAARAQDLVDRLPALARRARRCGDHVIVINAEKIKVTGKKMEQKKYYSHSGYAGGLKERTLKEVLEKKPEEVIRKAVWGMIPKNKLGRAVYKKLKVYRGSDHPHQAQKPQEYHFKEES
jgi:large subunit ribosomal protein L13